MAFRKPLKRGAAEVLSKRCVNYQSARTGSLLVGGLIGVKVMIGLLLHDPITPSFLFCVLIVVTCFPIYIISSKYATQILWDELQALPVQDLAVLGNGTYQAYVCVCDPVKWRTTALPEANDEVNELSEAMKKVFRRRLIMGIPKLSDDQKGELRHAIIERLEREVEQHSDWRDLLDFLKKYW